MTPQEIEALLQEHGSGQSQNEYDEAAEPAGARKRRTELLLPVLSTCQAVWSSKPEEMEAMAQKLGDGSRDGAWRLPLGDAGILGFFLERLAQDSLSRGLQVHSLRIVGNSCAYTDENRARVIQDGRLTSVIRLVDDETLIPFTVPVLYNILMDHGPAQLEASRSCLSRLLIAQLSSPALSKHAAFVPYICKILALLVTQHGELSAADPSTVHVLLSLAASPSAKENPDDFISLLGVAVAYLENDSFQSRLIADNDMGLFVDAFYHAYTNFATTQSDDPDTAAWNQLQCSLLAALADLSAHDSFSSFYPLSSPVSQSFLAWIHGTDPLLQSAACLALGNISRSDEASVGLVERDSIHVPIISLLSNPAVSDPQVLHSALSFVKNLAIPLKNKAELGGLLDASCVPRIYSLDSLPQVQLAAISLTRLLLHNCPHNVRRICTPLSAGPSSSNGGGSSVTDILSLFERTDAEPTKLEASRSIAAICRVLHSTTTTLSDVLPGWDKAGVPSDAKPDEPLPYEEDGRANHSQTDDEKRRSTFYNTHSLSSTLAFLVTQKTWPTLRSEAWFVFALMSRSKDGGAVVLNVLQVNDAMNALVETITGRKTSDSQAGDTSHIEEAHSTTQADNEAGTLAGSLLPEPQQVDPKKNANMAKVDRENAIVLCTELLRNWSRELPPLRLSLLQDLVNEGTDLVTAERSQR